MQILSDKMKGLSYLIKSDLFRYNADISNKAFIKNLFFNKGFKLTFWFRVAHHFKDNKLLVLLPKLIYAFYKRSLVTDINYKATIGPGFEFHHVFGSTFGEHVKIGRNVVLSHGVTLGYTRRGPKKGAPTIKDNVYIGPGALVIGNITIGNNVIIGGNAVVTKDIPDNSVVVGNPGKVISDIGSGEYIRNTDYDKHLKKM
jgi:serine O-acetyltransferase